MGSNVKFSNKLSAVFVAAGCSVGLGNIWRFPYIAGENGGGAFLFIYLLLIVIIGYPLLVSEFVVGRQTNRSSVCAYRTLDKRWTPLGYNGVLIAFAIMGFYYVVAGWTAQYFEYAVTGKFAVPMQGIYYKELFVNFILTPWKPVLYTWLFVAMTHFVIHMGVRKGLERVANILMPLLFIILIVLVINSLSLPNSIEGLKFFLIPDFSDLTPMVFLAAVGHAFFSLSIGLGAMITYGAYIPNDANIRSISIQVILLDVFVAILAGLIIFPATFSVGISTSSGPTLAFETLPAILSTLPMSTLWASIFFFLLVIAALTSTMSLHEVVTVFLIEEVKLPRNKAAMITSIAVGLLGTAAALSLSFTQDGHSLFDILDFVSDKILLPLGGMFTSIYIGWFMDRKMYDNQVTNNNTIPCSYLPILHFIMKYICPLIIFVIFLDSINII